MHHGLCACKKKKSCILCTSSCMYEVLIEYTDGVDELLLIWQYSDWVNRLLRDVLIWYLLLQWLGSTTFPV